MLPVASALGVVIVTAQPSCKSDPDTRQGDATRPRGHWDGQCHPRQPGPCDPGAPCMADGVQLQRGRGARVLNCSELHRRPRATRRRPDSGSFPRRMCQTPRNTCRAHVFSYRHSLPDDMAFST